MARCLPARAHSRSNEATSISDPSPRAEPAPTKTTPQHGPELLPRIWRRSVLESERRKQLRQFLIERRARLKPNDVGLAQRGLRRCPGLRRGEVAELAGVSANWYTMFEMARRNRRVSMRMIGRVATALRLDEQDR